MRQSASGLRGPKQARSIVRSMAVSIAVAVSAVGVLSGCAGPDRAPVVAPAVKASAQVAPTAGQVPLDPSVAPSDLTATSSTYFAECVDDNLVRTPKTLTLTCGDGNESLQDLTWTGWGEKEVRATGQLSTNTCEPSCAQGTVKRYPVSVVVGKLDKREASEFYSQITVTYPGDRPPGYDAIETIELLTPPK